MLEGFMDQFAGPRGPLGHVAGRLMARMNVPVNELVVDRLGVAPESRVLEVGFGPGLAVKGCAARAIRGLVAGVDRSPVMVRQARRRSRVAVGEGRVDLREGSAESLPWPNGHFTRACSINSLQFWPSPRDGLAEIHRVLSPGGRLLLALRMRTEGAGRYDRRSRGFSEERVRRVLEELAAVGFTSLDTDDAVLADEHFRLVTATARPITRAPEGDES